MVDKKRFNPLVLDPEDYDQLFDQPYEGEEDDKPTGNKIYETLPGGARRKRPIQNDY